MGMQLSWLERYTCTVEVVGSSPTFSTKIKVMDESGLLISLLLGAFMFVLGWLIGIERKNKLTKDLEFWKAYARELDNKNNGQN